MEEALPSISSGAVGSRFVSETEIDTAKARRDEQWKAAYARLGQEPPPRPVEDVYDGRSLAEKLAANRAAKQEEWEEKTKLANQFRALEEDEVLFLDSLKADEQRKELKRELEDAEEVKGFKEAVAAARNAAPQNAPAVPSTSPVASASSSSKAKPAQPTTAKKGPKNALKGVVVKKKRPTAAADSQTLPESTEAVSKRTADSEEEGSAKRRKLSSSSS